MPEKLSATQISKAQLQRTWDQMEQMEQMVHDIYHSMLVFLSNEPSFEINLGLIK